MEPRAPRMVELFVKYSKRSEVDEDNKRRKEIRVYENNLF